MYTQIRRMQPKDWVLVCGQVSFENVLTDFGQYSQTKKPIASLSDEKEYIESPKQATTP